MNNIKAFQPKDSLVGPYLFTLESDGVLPFKTLIYKTFEVFNEKIEEFITKLEELKIEA